MFGLSSPLYMLCVLPTAFCNKARATCCLLVGEGRVKYYRSSIEHGWFDRLVFSIFLAVLID